MRKSPKASTAVELVRSLRINDESLRSIAEDIKAHTQEHAIWVAQKRPLVQRKYALERELKERSAELTGQFQQGAPSAAAVQNYAKFELPRHPDIKRITKELDDCREALDFIGDTDSLFRERSSLLIALLKIDADVIISDKIDTWTQQEVSRAAVIRFNKVAEAVGTKWGNVNE